MATLTGVTSSTQERHILGPGTVSINDTVIGATRGGTKVEIIRTFRETRPDGAKGKIKQAKELIDASYKVTARLIEITEEMLTYALAGASVTTHVVTLSDIALTDYYAAVQFDAEMTGITADDENAGIEIELTNCLVTGPFVLDLGENGESVLEMVFEAHFDPDAMTTEPCTITFTPASA